MLQMVQSTAAVHLTCNSGHVPVLAFPSTPWVGLQAIMKCSAVAPAPAPDPLCVMVFCHGTLCVAGHLEDDGPLCAVYYMCWSQRMRAFIRPGDDCWPSGSNISFVSIRQDSVRCWKLKQLERNVLACAWHLEEGCRNDSCVGAGCCLQVWVTDKSMVLRESAALRGSDFLNESWLMMALLSRISALCKC